MSAAYCNWLSEQEGIPEDQWAYDPNEQGQYADGMKVKDNAVELTGYQLPTEEEWEYACRAGSSGTYGFGEPVPLLERYAQYVVNSSGRSQSVESLLPNAAGLFDMPGNVWEWTEYPRSGLMLPVRNNVSILMLGGAFYSRPEGAGSAYRGNASRPNYPADSNGFRLSRTYHLFP